MESESTRGMAKRMKTSGDDEDTLVEDGAIVEVPAEENEVTGLNSELVEMQVSRILEKINNYTQMVSELLESGKAMLKELSNDFEEKLILIHKEQIEKWQEDIKELRLLDTANEEENILLHNAKYLLESIHGGGS